MSKLYAKNMSRVLLIFVFISVVYPHQIEASGLELKITEYKNHYDAGSNVGITVLIKNTGPDEIILPALFIPEDYYIRFIIEDSNRKKAVFIGTEYKLIRSEFDLYRIKPGVFVGQELNLNEYYNIQQGSYRVYAIFEIKENRRNEKQAWVGSLISNEINFIVQ